MSSSGDLKWCARCYFMQVRITRITTVKTRVVIPDVGGTRIRNPFWLSKRLPTYPWRSLLVRRDQRGRNHRLFAAAATNSAYRRCIEIVRADREADVVLAGRPCVRDVEAAPAIDHPRLGPCVARDDALGVRIRVQIAAHVPRGHAEVTAARDENVRVVLADAVAGLESFERRRVHGG